MKILKNLVKIVLLVILDCMLKILSVKSESEFEVESTDCKV